MFISNNTIYVFAGKSSSWTNESEVPAIDKSFAGLQSVKDNMLFGKKVLDSNISQMIKIINWESGQIYDFYDDSDQDLINKNFYVINTLDRVYKCISNNKDTPSLYEPQSTSTSVFSTADGYIWKYMYTINSADKSKFAVGDYVPISANTTVQNAAVEGAIEYIHIDNEGSGWETYQTGTILQRTSNTIFKISTSISAVNGYFTDSSIYINSGTGSGFLSLIEDYYANSSGTYIEVGNANNNVQASDTYIISPTITIKGNGTGAKAYCIINTASGSVDSISVINIGSNYTNADISLSANSSLEGVAPTLRAIIAPGAGHGANPKTELLSNVTCISVQFSASEQNTIPTNVELRQFGIIENIKQYANNDAAYTSNTYNCVSEIEYNNKSGVFANHTTVEGQTTGARGTIVYSNSTVFGLTGVSTSFANNEILLNLSSNGTATVASLINNSDIDINHGDILFHKNTEFVTRSDLDTENVKFLLRTV